VDTEEKQKEEHLEKEGQLENKIDFQMKQSK
jgi:hypothetical protein